MRHPVAGCLVVLPALLAVASPPQSDAVILDETAYWRRYYRFGRNRLSAAALKREGLQTLKAGRYRRLQRDIERALREQGTDPRTVDWRDHAFLVLRGARAFNPFPTPPPPADWMAFDFDDRPWVRARRPFQGGRAPQITSPVLGQFAETVDLRLQAAYYRTRFVLGDPEAPGALTLRLAYSGGARAFLNGQELARGNLPQGGLAPDTPGDDYPTAAYRPGGARLVRRVLGPVRVPARLLRKGVNVLAVEIRASHFHPIVLTNPIQPNWGGPQRPFPHARLIDVELRGATRGVRPALRRPSGVQVWVEDMHHRTQSADFLPPGERPGVVRFVGARNGTYSAQIVVGADRQLTGLRVRPGDLRHVDGPAKLPASAIRVRHMVPFPCEEWTMKRLGDERGLSATFPSARELSAYAAMARPVGACLFDQLSPTEPEIIPAGSARPIWLSLRIPPHAAPGAYRGSVTVSAPAMTPATVPVELEVVAWRLPEPRDFQTFVGCEQNPYGVAKQYGVELWSEEHFKLLEASFRQLGRVGNDWLNVPVLVRTEFGNQLDSMIRWIRKRDGSLAFDYSILDRYVNLALKHCGRPRVIQFVVMQGMKSRAMPPAPPQVAVFDEATGQRTLLAVGGARGRPAPGQAPHRVAWRAFATSLQAHMRARGLEKSMYWGAPLEHEADPSLKFHLAACAPGVYWTAGGHEIMANARYCRNERFYRIITDIRYHGGWPSFRMDQGWKSKIVHLANPRVGGTSFALHTTSLPFAYRVMVDRALALGRTGFTRVGADEWAGIHYEGMDIPRWLTGIPVLFVLWPGRNGAEPSARFEALLEGIQETEARIFLEQALDRRRLPRDAAARVRKVLTDHFQETNFWQGNSLIHSMEAYHYGWQERSRRLHRAAAEVASLLQERTPRF